MLPFTKLGRYEITRELGRGGMGIVLAATDPMIDRMVALKIIKFDESLEAERKEELLERFLIEAKAAGKLTHPNIVTIYDVAREDQTYYIAMEFLEGKNLAETIRATKKLPFERATKIILQVAAGLKFAHDKQIIHRDIKPGNIYLIADDHVKILDFGLARLQTASSVTQTGHAVGSPQYMSPEQVRGQKMDGRTDIFSMGVMYYEMLTGSRPFEAESVTSLLYKIMDYDPPTPAMVEGTLPPAVDRVVAKMMAKKAENRYQNCGELMEDLNRLLADPATFTGGDSSFEKTAMLDAQGMEATAMLDAVPAKEKSKAGIAAAGVLAAVALWAGYVYLSSNGGQGVKPPAQQAAVEAPSAIPSPPAPTPAATTAQEAVEKPKEASLPAEPSKSPGPVSTAPAPQPPVEEKKVKPASVLVAVASNVPGEVFINGRQAGATPLQDFEVSAGEIKVAVKADLHKTWEQTVNAKGGEKLPLQAVLEPAGGTVKVTSAPSGADVLVDGEKIGATPLLTGAIPPGTHSMEIRAPGMAPYRQEVAVTKDKSLAVSATLRQAVGTLAVAGTAGATLYIDGKEAGALPAEKSLPPGKYELKAAKAGHKPAVRRVEVAVDKRTEESFELEALGVGTLTITAIPWAEIKINGQPAGTTPKTIRNVPEGEVVVSLTNPGFAPVEKTVTVAKDQTTPVAHTFAGQASPATATAAKVEKAAAFGSLRVKSHPDALVFLDGKLAGRGALVEVKDLPVGKHKLVVKIGGKQDLAREVTITEGASTPITLD